MTVGIVGMGLIGGSAARAYKLCGHTVLARDLDETMLSFAILDGAADEPLTAENIGRCDLILVALYPRAAIEFVRQNAPRIRKDAVVIDLCGTKRTVCQACFPIAREYGFTFVGGHPMAGTQFSGYKNSRAGLFQGASMVIVPPVYDDIAFLDRIKQLLAPLKLGSMTVTTAEEHDRMIAFTSQLAHVVSNAYVKSPTAQAHKGFSAGSYRDLTRVAWMNVPMWAELFLENADYLIPELDAIIGALGQYRDAMAAADRQTLEALLADGKRLKEQVDG
jgi:prephenate dehydrogenase